MPAAYICGQEEAAGGALPNNHQVGPHSQFQFGVKALRLQIESLQRIIKTTQAPALHYTAWAEKTVP